MGADGSRSHAKKLGAIAFWSFAGAAAGLAFGLAIVGLTLGTTEAMESHGITIIIGAFAATGAFIGAAAGAKIIRAVGWMMFAGAILGGVTAELISGIGKTLMYGAPFGAIVALVLGLRRQDRPPKQYP